ncbi:hypothetical protein Tco_1323128 [Tanacetum coccineum]
MLSPSPPGSPIHPLGYRAAMIRLRAKAASTSYSLPLPQHLHLLFTDRGEDRLEVTLPPRKRLGITLGLAYEVEESSSAAPARPAGGLRANYSFVATMDKEIRRDPERDSGRQLLAGRLNMLFRDRHAHAHTARLIETEARMSREAWGRSMDASDLAHTEVMSLRTIVLAQMSKIRELQDAERRRQVMISEMLKADQRRSAEMRELRIADHTRQQQLIQTLTGQQGPVRGPAQPELPEEAGSTS